MLSYTLTNLSQEQFQDVGKEKFDFVGDLFAEILYISVSRQIKQGLIKDYKTNKELVHGVKGKLNISDSVKKLSMINKSMVCEYDVYTENILLNQIIKTTAYILIRSKDIKKPYKDKLKKTLLFFSSVDYVKVDNINFNTLKLNKNNKNYQLIINVCYLIIKGLLMDTSGSEIKFKKYIDSDQLYNLFENFVLKYYQKHYPELKPKRSFLNWQTKENDSNNLALLPIMKTDIELHGKEKILIIDTKYYKNSLIQSNFRQTYRSNHIYQIYSYVSTMQLKTDKTVSGLLLYAKTDSEDKIDQNTSLNNFDISFKNLDLNQDFVNIKTELNKIAERITS